MIGGAAYVLNSRDPGSVLHHRDSPHGVLIILLELRDSPTHNVLVLSSRDCPLRHLGVIPFVCPADSVVPKQLPIVKAIDYRAVTFQPQFRIKLTRNNHCERGLSKIRCPSRHNTWSTDVPTLYQ